MYNAFTHPGFRGRHLHAAAVKQVLPKLAERGITRVIASIEWTNFASLRSFQRMGCQRLGRLWALGAATSASASVRVRRERLAFGLEAMLRYIHGSQIRLYLLSRLLVRPASNSTLRLFAAVAQIEQIDRMK